MKKIFVVSLLLLSVLAVNAAELFYNNGTSVSIQKAEDMHAVKSDASKSEGRKDALYRLNTGLEVYSFVSGTEKRGGDELPVYFFGDMPLVAERTVFWRGEKSVEYMEKQYDMKLVEILPTYPLYAFSVKGALLAVGGTLHLRRDVAEENILELVHSRVGKHQRGVVLHYHRCRGHDGMSLGCKEIQELLSYLFRSHHILLKNSLQR